MAWLLSIQLQVLKYREKDGHFTQSAAVRDPKPPHVQYRVGQVVKHKLWGYHGVIIGWDEQVSKGHRYLSLSIVLYIHSFS